MKNRQTIVDDMHAIVAGADLLSFRERRVDMFHVHKGVYRNRDDEPLRNCWHSLRIH